MIAPGYVGTVPLGSACYAQPDPIRLRVLPMRLNFAEDAIADDGPAPRNRASQLVHHYAGARAIDPYAHPTRDLIAAMVRDLEALARELA